LDWVCASYSGSRRLHARHLLEAKIAALRVKMDATVERALATRKAASALGSDSPSLIQ
jgi:hypothetical protein